MRNILVPVLLLLYAESLFSQEYTVFLNGNPQIQKIADKNSAVYKKNKSLKSIAELPFWDDFSENKIYPDTSLWTDNQVYINRTLSVNPPSLGVATLDAVNSAGQVYDYANYNEPFFADTLTSKPVNLNYPGNNTIFLSFFYQPQGVGDAPETEDSLLLEFYAPEENKWNTVWAAAGSPNKDFELVMIQINDNKYLKSGFQFRFKNIASFGTSTYPSLATNCDFWNIDYVYLNKDRNINDTVFHDIAFTSPLHSLLSNYEAVPWEHFKTTTSQTLNNNIDISFRNNDDVMRLIDSLNFSMKDLTGTSGEQYWKAGTYTPSPFSDYGVILSGQPFVFSYNNADTSDFLLTAEIITDSYDSVKNNKVSYVQKFKDYYAYDDGSAEAGYGIYGNGTKYGQVALKYSPLKSGYLTGVDMYFTQAFQNGSQKYFWIYIWKAGQDGKPGDTIKTFEGIKPEYENEINKFHKYIFDEPVLIEGDFFIGWTQTTEDKLNIGFDFNTDNSAKAFYNISGEWQQSAEIGSLMIRPVFGDIAGNIEYDEKKTLTVYPNPVKDIVKLNFNRSPGKTYYLQVFDIQGKLIYYNGNFKQDYFYARNMKNGIYLIKITDNNSEMFTAKFIKQ